MTEHEALGSPTPDKNQKLQIDEASTSKPKQSSSQKIKKLLRL
jgi:hypothetical protein